MVYYTYSKNIVYLYICLFKWQVCCQLHTPIWPLASQYLWLSGVEDKAVHLNKCCWSISSNHKVCSKDGEIFHCDVDVLQGKSYPEGRRKCAMSSLLGRLQLSLLNVFWNLLIASLWTFISVIILQSVVLAVWYDLSLSLCVWSKWLYLLRHQLFYFMQFHSGLGFILKQLSYFLSLIFAWIFWHFWTSVVLEDCKLFVACTADFESEDCMGEFIT